MTGQYTYPQYISDNLYEVHLSVLGLDQEIVLWTKISNEFQINISTANTIRARGYAFTYVSQTINNYSKGSWNTSRDGGSARGDEFIIDMNKDLRELDTGDSMKDLIVKKQIELRSILRDRKLNEILP